MRNFKRYIAAMMAILMLIALVLPISATEETEEDAAAENGYDRGYADGRSGDGKIYAHGLDISVWQGENFDFSKVSAAGFSYVILRAGVSYEKATTGVVVWENGEYNYYAHRRLEKGSHGTGDIYASAFVGALMNDKSVYEAAKIAADYTVKCIINTQGDADHWYGAKFETALGDLMKMLT